MGETEWKHAGWVSGLGKWAWIILLILGVLRIIVELVGLIPAIAAWESARALWDVGLLGPFPVPHPILGLIWPLIGGIISIFLALIIIRPKFSNPCGEKDWETLYGWTLKLGGKNVPWMFIWGIIFMIFGWFYITGVFVLIPAIMLIWFGPRKYEW
ncbi:MAG: hypothetical protein EAX91_16425 [Candidatus Lokiarchaeota archaeon]|nr:hypothetical protein [Candidatus Lokiarchaeota archaeon]